MDLPDDRELIDTFRRVTRTIPTSVVIRDSGLSESSVKRFKREGYYPNRLEAEVRIKLATFLATRIDEGFGKVREVSRATYGADDVATDDEVLGSALVSDPRLIRRLVMDVLPEHRQSRLAIIHTVEKAFIARGQAIPGWLEELRRDALA